ENVPPASSTLSVPSNPITCSSARVQSPRISTNNLSTSSASPLPIHPPSLAPPLLTVPTTTTATSSQDEIVLDINPPPFSVPHHRERHLALTPLAVSNPNPPSSNDQSQNQPRSPASHSTSLLERLRIGRSPASLGSTGGRQSPAAISVISTDEEMTLLHPPHRLTNTPTDDEEETLPDGWTRQIWVPEQVEGVARLCRAILRYRQAHLMLSDAMK